MTTQTADPLDTAMETEYNPTKLFFGQVQVDSYFCVFEKNEQTGKFEKRLFDPLQHKENIRRTMVDISIQPLPESKAKFPLERSFLAESQEWSSFVKPSLRDLNTDLRAVNNKWAKVELVPTGKTYTNKQSGEEKQKTAIKFLEIYMNEQDCQAAADATFGTDSNGSQPAAAPAQQPVNNAEKATAEKFLPALWKQSGEDVTKFAELIAKNQLVSKYFDINSPEVANVIAPF